MKATTILRVGVFLLSLLLQRITVQAAGTMIDVAVRYDLKDETSDCTSHADRLQRVSSLATYNAGLLGNENEDHWNIFANLHNKMVKIENKMDMENNGASDGGRRRLCDSFCEFMCLIQGTYCWCCSCCGSGRRRSRNLRQLNDIVLDDDPVVQSGQLDDLEEIAEEEVYKLLDQWNQKVPCLAYPYTATVEIVPVGTPNYEDAKAARKAARRARKEQRKKIKNNIKALRATKKEARQKLREIREQLKAARQKVWRIMEAEMEAEKALKEAKN